ncbi:(2Fe-2S)-binding protein [Kineococcus sp. SYSU DK018]|uniref:(2Fe-2S)-binding protein n=1 Tax=Kineococcus sp. SYSU DK018 TaxID=3383139 RepID=UPI003D7EB0A2
MPRRPRPHDPAARGPAAVPAATDPVRPRESAPLTLLVDGAPVRGVQGQTVAGVLLADGQLSWRRTSRHGKPRGVFCGIGACFDCLVVVNGARDVRACQRRAQDGDVVERQDDPCGGGTRGGTGRSPAVSDEGPGGARG